MPAGPAGERAADRAVWRLTGPDTIHFLQGLVTNDVRPLEKGPGIVWTAFLTPQGKYLADFFLVRPGDAPEGEILLDIQRDLSEPTLRRLAMYRLRAKVEIAATDMTVTRGLDGAPPGAFADPRHPAMGWRAYGLSGGPARIDWDALRVAHVIPESGRELVPDDSYILEAGFERLHGVDFRKGCYVGQEVTARMKHKTELRKGFVQVQLDGPAAEGTEITAGDRPAGRLHTRAGDRAIAYLRLDRAAGELRAGAARVTICDDGKGS